MAKSTEVNIVIKRELPRRLEVVALGSTPFICNRMPMKLGTAGAEMVQPSDKKTMVERQTVAKHNVTREFRDSPYTLKDETQPTLLAFLAGAFKKAMATAALDIPGARKAQINRLLWVENERLPLYGIPRLFMSVVRSAGIGNVPDIRTRAILPEWAMRLTITFVYPMLNEDSVVNLAAAAGDSVGVGDWRKEKGAGTYGSFVITTDEHTDVQRIMTTGGRKAQEEAMDHPLFYDDESEELFQYWQDAVKKRSLILKEAA